MTYTRVNDGIHQWKTMKKCRVSIECLYLQSIESRGIGFSANQSGQNIWFLQFGILEYEYKINIMTRSLFLYVYYSQVGWWNNADTKKKKGRMSKKEQHFHHIGFVDLVIWGLFAKYESSHCFNIFKGLGCLSKTTYIIQCSVHSFMKAITLQELNDKVRGLVPSFMHNWSVEDALAWGHSMIVPNFLFRDCVVGMLSVGTLTEAHIIHCE